MHNAGRRDDLVGRVAAEVHLGGDPRNRKVDWPHVKPVQSAHDLPVIHVEFHPAQLSELGQLPKYDGRNGPPVSGQKNLLGGPQRTAQRMDDDVRIKV